MKSAENKKIASEFRNGVNVTELVETINAVIDQPEIAKFKFRTADKWLDGSINRFSCKEYYGLCEEQDTRKEAFTFEADEPPMLLGEDSAPNPVEYLLGALASCLTTSLVYHAAANGIDIEAMSSEFEGDLDLQGFLGLDQNVPRGFSEIRTTFKVKTDADKAKLEELMKHSPVFNTIVNPTPVKITLETN